MKNKSIQFSLVLLLALFFLACQSKKTEEASQAPASQAPAANKQKGPQGTAKYPAMTWNELEPLWENCDLIDFMFFDLPISMSYPEKAGIQTTLSHISTRAAIIDPSCKPIGQIFYNIEGDNVYTADLYYNPPCFYYVFSQKGKKVFANDMTPEGIQALGKILNQVQTQ